jgi:hypothetical protein
MKPTILRGQMTDETLQLIEKELEIIKQRNARVEADKAWEASPMRIGTICTITYLVAAVLLYTIGAHRFWLDALVPPLGFFLSTQSLPPIKRWWITCRYQPKNPQ